MQKNILISSKDSPVYDDSIDQFGTAMLIIEDNELGRIQWIFFLEGF